MKKVLVSSLIVFSMLMGALGFAQSISVVDNGPATPTTDIRVFGSGFQAVVGISEIASTSELAMPTQVGVATFQFNTDDQKLYIRVLDSDGASWGGSVQLTTLD